MRMRVVKMARPLSLSLLLLLVLVQSQDYDNNNYDQFTYKDDPGDANDPNNVYPPPVWDRVGCNDLEECIGWPDTWETGIEWDLEPGVNHCQWCPASEDGGIDNNCGTHHQSPIDLQRNRAIAGHELENECIDVHWMEYFDSSCTWEELVKYDAFSIERHALKVIQPMREVNDDEYVVACDDNGSRFGRIDFSKGFSDYWHLSHTDIHVPSEHTQEGKRYDAEIQMYHFYSVSGRKAGVDNQMASVTVFLQAYPDAPDYDVLNRLICQWRKVEEQTRQECELPSVPDEYSGCTFYQRGHTITSAATTTTSSTTTTSTSSNTRQFISVVNKAFLGTNIDEEPDQGHDGGRRLGQDRNLLRTSNDGNVEEDSKQPLVAETKRKRAISAFDVLLHNELRENGANGGNSSSIQHKKIRMDETNFAPDPDFDWDDFVASVYKQEEETRRQREDGTHRELIDYDHIGPWFNYWPLIACKTEYYYRYSGTQTIPPCYGRFTPQTRGYTNHWRVMKDPGRVSQRQIDELHRLLRERIAPKDDPLRSCQPDTAAKVDPVTNKVSVARPLQSFHKAHFKTFCECQDWRSKWEEDKAWCMIDQLERYYIQPYNFITDGF